MLKIYAFALTCDGFGQYKAMSIIKVRDNEDVALQSAMEYWKKEYPENLGWCNHQSSGAVLENIEWIVEANKESKNE